MSQVFRSAAIDRLDAPEELDRLLKTTSPRGWVAVGTAMVLALVLALWGVTGRIPDRISGRAALVAAGSITQIYTSSGGYVRNIAASQGQRVRAGDTVLRVGKDLTSASTTEVVASRDGEVAEIMVRPGQHLSPGQQVAVMIGPVHPADQRALMFASPDVAARIKPGMTAQVAVDTADQEVYGTIPGRVVSVQHLAAEPTGH